jgi:hypothetical protein
MNDKISTELEVIKGKKFVDLDEFADWYYAITVIEKKVKSVKEAIKKQGSDMMFRNLDNVTKIEHEKFIVSQQQGSESKDYNPKQVIEVFTELLGEFAWTLVETKNAKVNELLASMLMTGGITTEQVERLNEKSSVKRRKGFLTLREKKDNKLLV